MTADELMPYQAFSALKHGHAKHGASKASPTYQSWLAMHTRCRRKYNSKQIIVCDSWGQFENFLADMGERPSSTTLDRIDNSGNYFPENCRWATVTQQARNRSNKKLEYMEAYTICCRMLSGYSAKSIAEEFQCSESLPREIVKGRTWKDACKAAYEFMGVKECPVK